MPPCLQQISNRNAGLNSKDFRLLAPQAGRSQILPITIQKMQGRTGGKIGSNVYGLNWWSDSSLGKTYINARHQRRGNSLTAGHFPLSQRGNCIFMRINFDLSSPP